MYSDFGLTVLGWMEEAKSKIRVKVHTWYPLATTTYDQVWTCPADVPIWQSCVVELLPFKSLTRPLLQAAPTLWSALLQLCLQRQTPAVPGFMMTFHGKGCSMSRNDHLRAKPKQHMLPVPLLPQNVLHFFRCSWLIAHSCNFNSLLYFLQRV